MNDSKLSLNVEMFVTAFPPPQRARVTQGFSPSCCTEDEEEIEEFSTDDVIEIKRPLCPYVSLTFPYPPTHATKTISVSSNYGDLFKIVPQSKIMGSSKPYVYRSVQELVDIWPSVVKAVNDCDIDSQCYYRRGDVLRLLRITASVKDFKTYECEFKNTRTSVLFRLPSSHVDHFQEVKDERVYTLLELIEERRVSRVLQFADPSDITLPWMPLKFNGYIFLNQPRLLFEVKRIYEEAGPSSEPILNSILAIDLDIELSPRDSAYSPMEELGYELTDIVKNNKRKPPFIVQVTSWKEQTCTLNYNHIFPGNHLIIHERKTISKILAESNGRYFLIPINHDGIFRKVDPISLHISSTVQLNSSHLLPTYVIYCRSDKYMNLEDDTLPVKTPIRLIETVSEDSLLVSKILYDRICCPFHLPLRTGIKVRIHGSWRSEIREMKLSYRNEFAEEICPSLYESLLKSKDGSSRNSNEDKDAGYIIGRLLPSLKPILHTLGSHVLPSQSNSQDASNTASEKLNPTGKPTPPKKPPVVPPKNSNSLKGPAPPEKTAFSTEFTPHRGHYSEQPQSSTPPFRSLPLPPSRSASLSSTTSPVPPPRTSKKRSTLTRDSQPSTTLNRSSATSDDYESDSDGDHAYCYIDMTTLLPNRNVSGQVPIDIPLDGNLSHFTVNEMMTFLQESNVPPEVVEKLRQASLDGQKFAKMDDEGLKSNGLASPVIVFFRNRSKALGIINQL